MRYLIPMFALSLALSGSGLKMTISAMNARGVELVKNDGSVFARVFFGGDSLRVDLPLQQRSYLFNQGYYVFLNRGDQTYRVHSYGNIVASLPAKASSDIASSQQPPPDRGAGGFTATGETAVIAGLSATKLVRTSQGEVEVEMWVSEESTPTGLRAVRREIRGLLPTNFWDHDYATPTLIQAILVFGLPLRIVDHTDEASELRAVVLKNEDVPNDPFEIPSAYRQRDAEAARVTTEHK